MYNLENIESKCPEVDTFLHGTIAHRSQIARTTTVTILITSNSLIRDPDNGNTQINTNIYIKHHRMASEIIASTRIKSSKLIFLLFLMFFISKRYYWDRRQPVDPDSPERYATEFKHS